MTANGNASNFPALINEPGMQKAFGEDLHRLIVVPSGRGPFGWSDDYSERDELDVLRAWLGIPAGAEWRKRTAKTPTWQLELARRMCADCRAATFGRASRRPVSTSRRMACRKAA